MEAKRQRFMTKLTALLRIIAPVAEHSPYLPLIKVFPSGYLNALPLQPKSNIAGEPYKA